MFRVPHCDIVGVREKWKILSGSSRIAQEGHKTQEIREKLKPGIDL